YHRDAEGEEIRYHPGKANIIAYALRRKELTKPLRVRASMMTINPNQLTQIYEAQVEAFEKKNVKDENLHSMDKEFETRLGETLCSRSKSNRDHQKDYVNERHKPLEFQVRDKVMLKVSPWKGVIHFGKRGKLNPRYIGPFKILAKVGTVAYQLELPEQLSRVHSTFRMSNLKRCLSDETQVILLDEIQIDNTFHFIEEPVEIMDREVKRLKQSRCDLDNGLEPIACDRDVVVLGNYVTQGLKLVEVFVEHEKTNPDIYTPPKAKRIVIEELDAEPIISKAGITPVARKIVLDVTNNQTCGKEKGKSSGKDLEGQSSGKDLEGQSSAVGNDGSYEESQDPNFDPFADLDLILPTMGDWEGNTSEHVDLGDETNNVETECNDDERHRVEETQGDDDRHGEEQTGGDHEIHDEEEREGDDESDSQDSDYIVDSDNNVDDIDVDMADFEYNIDEDVEFGGCRDREEAANVEEEDAEELEVLDNDYFESAF
ncbi:hypothetical protein Tco_1325623, partial [Tanacetum coccineum]